MALNARNPLPARPAKSGKASKQLRPAVVAIQKRGVQVLLSQADTAAKQGQPHSPVRSAYTGEVRVRAAGAGKPRLAVK